jgi:PAS domain S-box-containing protein
MVSPIRVLLVEDNPGDARLLREAVGEVTGPDLEWVTVERLGEAIRRLPEEQLDVILLDLSLPDSHGFETFARAVEAAPDLPIVVLTGLDDEDLAVRTVQAGAQDYLVKGHLDGHLLVRAIRYAIERRRSVHALEESERRFRAIFDQTFEFIGMLAPDGTLLEANHAALEYVGAEPAQVIGHPFWETPWWAHDPELKAWVRGAIAEAASGKFVRREVEHPGADGVVRPFDFSLKAVRDESGRVALLIPEGRDISERKRAEMRLAAQHAVTRVLAESATLAEATPRLLQCICESMEWELGEIWAVDRETNELRCVDLWHTASPGMDDFAAADREITFPPGVGLPGRVWSTGEPAWVTGIREAPGFIRAAAVARTNLHGAFAFPLRVESTITGVIEFFSPEARPPDESMLQAIAALGSQIGQFMERKRAEEERDRLLALEREKSEQLKLSVREAHHRIKNNLQSISDLLYLELTGGDGATAEDALRESIDRIQAIATVHDLLSQDEDVRVVDARIVLERLVPMVLRSGGPAICAANVEMDVASVPLSSKRATAVALIVNELVSNAVKHTCRNGKAGKIRLSLRQDSEDLVLRVRDNGPGLPADFDLERDSHVGLAVVRTLAERDLNGCFNLKDEGGVLAEVRFVW